jgi:hypothetical protein
MKLNATCIVTLCGTTIAAFAVKADAQAFIALLKTDNNLTDPRDRDSIELKDVRQV